MTLYPKPSDRQHSNPYHGTTIQSIYPDEVTPQSSLSFLRDNGNCGGLSSGVDGAGSALQHGVPVRLLLLFLPARLTVEKGTAVVGPDRRLRARIRCPQCAQKSVAPKHIGTYACLMHQRARSGRPPFIKPHHTGTGAAATLLPLASSEDEDLVESMSVDSVAWATSTLIDSLRESPFTFPRPRSPVVSPPGQAAQPLRRSDSDAMQEDTVHSSPNQGFSNMITTSPVGRPANCTTHARRANRGVLTNCIGLHLRFPENRTPIMDYPFGIHTSSSIPPWTYKLALRGMMLISDLCTRAAEYGHYCCSACRSIRQHPLYDIVRSSIHGTSIPNSPPEHISLREHILQHVFMEKLVRWWKAECATKDQELDKVIEALAILANARGDRTNTHSRPRVSSTSTY